MSPPTCLPGFLLAWFLLPETWSRVAFQQHLKNICARVVTCLVVQIRPPNHGGMSYAHCSSRSLAGAHNLFFFSASDSTHVSLSDGSSLGATGAASFSRQYADPLLGSLGEARFALAGKCVGLRVLSCTSFITAHVPSRPASRLLALHSARRRRSTTRSHRAKRTITMTRIRGAGLSSGQLEITKFQSPAPSGQGDDVPNQF